MSWARGGGLSRLTLGPAVRYRKPRDRATGREAASPKSERPGLGSGAGQNTPRSTRGGRFVLFGATMGLIITANAPLRARATSFCFPRPRASGVLRHQSSVQISSVAV